jgi:antitoxin MazE
MRIAKWGNSLALRIPAEVVEKLGLTAEDDAQIRVTGENSFEVIRDRRRQIALERLRKMRFEIPENFVFDRDEIYDN